jgi:ribosomal protein L31E
MSSEILERDDLSVYIIAGVPRSFKAKLRQFVQQESKKEGDIVLVDTELAEWIVSRLRDEKRPTKLRTPASRALWRAFSALSAARYHMMSQGETEERVLELRRKVEELWRESSPMFEDKPPGEEDATADVEGESTVGKAGEDDEAEE